MAAAISRQLPVSKGTGLSRVLSVNGVCAVSSIGILTSKAVESTLKLFFNLFIGGILMFSLMIFPLCLFKLNV